MKKTKKTKKEKKALKREDIYEVKTMSEDLKKEKISKKPLKKKEKTKKKKSKEKKEKNKAEKTAKETKGVTLIDKHFKEKSFWVLTAIAFSLVIANAWIYFVILQESEVVSLGEKQKPAVEEKIENDLQNPTKEVFKPEEQEVAEDLSKFVLSEEEKKGWKTYANRNYGFTFKYPSDWPAPVVEKKLKDSKYLFKVVFRNQEEAQGQKKFSIYAYKVLKRDDVINPNYTDNLTIKETASPDFTNCKEMETLPIGPEKYPAVEVTALENDPCFEEAYFVFVKKDNYIFDLVPEPASDFGHDGYNGRKETIVDFPEFYKIISSFELTQIATVKVVKKITAPPPVAAVRRGGRLVCAKKNDKPRKSKQNKGKHLDMECCLDPDEWPNPHCAY